MPGSQFYVGGSYSGDTFVYLSSPSYSLGRDNGSVLEAILNTFTSNLVKPNLLNLADRKEKKDRIVLHQYLLWNPHAEKNPKYINVFTW